MKRNRREGLQQTDADAWANVDPFREFVIAAAAGALVGLVCAIALREARLSWWWAPICGVPLGGIAWLIDWRLAIGCGFAVLVASALGSYMHREALDRGGSEAREEREVPNPISWALTRRRARRRRERDDEFVIGRTRRGELYRLPLGLDRGIHGLVLGATGSGKTVTQAAIAQAYIRTGLPVIVVDPKGDAWLRDVLLGSAADARAEFRCWTPSGPSVYNPFARGGPTEIADKALAGHRWTEPHYEQAARRLLGQASYAMHAAGEWPPTLSTVVRYMDPERLDGLASRVGGAVADRVSEYVDGLSGRARADLGGGRDRLAVLVESELGPWLDPSLNGGGEPFNLQSILERREVAYFHTDADRYPAASKLLGAALVIDLVSLSANLQGGNLRGLLVIDEFAAIAADQVSRLFGTGRGAGLSVLLGTQSLADVRTARPDDPTDTLTDQLMDNIEHAIVHSQRNPDSAERLAQMAGTDPSWVTTRRVSGLGALSAAGVGTRTREREFLFNPDEFKRLKTGEAVIISPTADPPAEMVRIRPPGIRP